MAYFAERVGMQEVIKQMLEAKLGRICVRRTSSSSFGGVLSAVESSCMDLESIPVAKDIPSEHNVRFHDRTHDTCS